MATIFESTGDDREQRIAELKQKMQQSAKRNQEAAAANTSNENESNESGSAAVAEATPVMAAAVATEGTATEDTAMDTPAVAPVATSASEVAVAESTPVAAAATAPAAVAEFEEVQDDGQAAMTRREFLTYAWGASLGLLAVETGLLSYFFMYPRFRAGEFGGKFFLPLTEVPAADAPPSPQTAGKFWLVNTDEGPKALYMVCTHLGCLYKWEASNSRFECPCHGSKFSKAGFYIEGPAPRSLDTFVLTEENGQIVVDTGAKTTGNPSSESPDRVVIT